MTSEHFSPQESIKVIQNMIDKTKQQMSDNSHYFLVWGWLTFIAFISQFILKNQLHYEKHYYVWLVVFFGITYQIVYSIKEKKQSRVKTFIGENMASLWSGMGITFFVMSMLFSRIGWSFPIYPFFIMLYGLGTFVSGKFLQFRPLMLGGVLAWILAIASVYTSYDYQMLFAAAAILLSYIIPAYLLRKKNKSSAK